MTDNRTTELLPCPFCGGEAYHYAPGPIEHHIACKNYKECGADIERNTEAEAIAAWNTRAPVEYDGWFYLPKPKENVVQYGEPRIEKTETGYRAEQPVEVIESAIRSWGDEIGEYIMKRLCEVWNIRAELDDRTCKIVATSTNNLMYPDYMTKWYELSCGHSLNIKGDEAPKWCAVCGKVVIG